MHRCSRSGLDKLGATRSHNNNACSGYMLPGTAAALLTRCNICERHDDNMVALQPSDGAAQRDGAAVAAGRTGVVDEVRHVACPRGVHAHCV